MYVTLLIYIMLLILLIESSPKILENWWRGEIDETTIIILNVETSVKCKRKIYITKILLDHPFYIL